MISIITPVYNGERFIESCIKAVIDQNCPNVEHIIVDGGSSDRTIEIIQEYAQKYPHICWISEKDRGQSDAMNKGINLAQGEIVGFLNVDDFYEPNVLNRVLEIFKTLPEPSFLAGNCKVIGESGELIEFNQPAKLSLYDLLMYPDRNPYPYNPAAYFYHASLHQRVGYYNVDDHYSMDLDFILRAVRVANLCYVDETWGNHRRLEGTKTFEDLKAGKTNQRIIKLYRYYRRYLPLSAQLKLFLQENWIRIVYVLKYPHKFPQVIQRKLADMLD